MRIKVAEWIPALAALLVAAAASAQGGGYQIGSTVKDFALKDDKGKVQKLSQYRGKHVVLAFYASW